jgi:hypothetical protein
MPSFFYQNIFQLFYPDFHNWFYDNVVPGVFLGNDEIILAEYKNKIVSIAILKKQAEKN